MSNIATAGDGVGRVVFAGQTGDEAGQLEGALRARGIDVRRARTAEDALTIIAEYEPDMVVVHWQRLDRTGPDFLRQLREAVSIKTPFVAANAAPMNMNARERTEALSEGADIVFPAYLASDELDASLAMATRRMRQVSAYQARMERVLAKLGEMQSRFESLDGDLMEARRLQQGLMRDRNLSVGEIQISLVLRSCGHVGGDLVGHFPINERAIGFYALDVSGHGVSSALMTARLAGYLSATNLRQNIAVAGAEGRWRPRSPAAALVDLNNLVMEDLETDHYFTMLLGHLDPTAGRVVFAQAGHPHPVHLDAAGQMSFVGSGGLPVGLIPGADYEDTQMQLNAGDRLYILSDGFSEAEMPSGGMVGDEGLLTLLAASKRTAAPKVLEALIWDLSQTIGEADFQDDLSGVLIDFSGNPKT